MKALSTLAALALAAAGTSCLAQAQTPAPPAMSAATEACFRANAEAVERSVQDLDKAVDFLTEYVCAKEVAADKNALWKRQQEATRLMIRKQCDTLKANPKSKADDEDGSNYCWLVDSVYGSDASITGAPTFATVATPETRALAAKLLLDLRLKRSKP
jgi:hypothetical protein